MNAAKSAAPPNNNKGRGTSFCDAQFPLPLNPSPPCGALNFLEIINTDDTYPQMAQIKN